MLYWEDFKVGETIELGSHTFTEEEIIAFANQFDPQPFHTDSEAAKHTFYGGLIASGWHTCCIAMRYMVQNYVGRAASMGSPGVDNVRWLKPVRPGDTITFRRTILESRASASRPTVGLVKSSSQAVNQNGETVLTMEGWNMFRRRPVA